jgi:CheY-like chemotaxis protein
MEKPVVLIVGDNALVRSEAAERLRAAGFEVVEAATSAEADCVLRTTLVDAVIQTTSAA